MTTTITLTYTNADASSNNGDVTDNSRSNVNPTGWNVTEAAASGIGLEDIDASGTIDAVTTINGQGFTATANRASNMSAETFNQVASNLSFSVSLIDLGAFGGTNNVRFFVDINGNGQSDANEQIALFGAAATGGFLSNGATFGTGSDTTGWDLANTTEGTIVTRDYSFDLSGVSAATLAAWDGHNIGVEFFSQSLDDTQEWGIVDFSGTMTICLTAGTMIATPEGERAIEDLRAGDMVLTMDDGAQPIRWIGENVFDKAALEANPKMLPIRIQAGSLGKNVPAEDLLVSRQHRILVRSKIALRMFGSEEVLVPANKLLAIDGIDIAWDVEQVRYWHFLFDRHQIIWSNGAATESLFTGPEALKAVSPEAREEIMTIFPEICRADFVPEPAREIAENGNKVKSFARRTKQKGMKVFH